MAVSKIKKVRKMKNKAETEVKKEEEYFTRYVIENGKMKEMKVSKKEALKDIDELLEEDKEFLEIMAKM